MTDIADRENLTINLAQHRLRLQEELARTTTYGPNPAAETLIIDQRDGSLYRYPAPVFTPMGHSTDAWIFDITGELQEPPTGTPPTLPPLPPADPKPAVRPRGYRGGKRRAMAVRDAVLVTVLLTVAAYSGLVLAAVAVAQWT